MTSRTVKVAFVLTFALGATLAHAQGIRPSYAFPAPPERSGPASVQMGSSPFYFAPYIGLAAGHDDNLFLSSTNPKKSALYIVSPGLKIDARSERSVFQLSYQAQIGRYSSSKSDDYDDHVLRGQFDFAFDRRNFLRAGYEYIRGHDPRGSTDRPVSATPDEYRFPRPN